MDRATEVFVKNAMVQAVGMMTETATNHRLVIDVELVRIGSNTNWLYVAFGNPNDTSQSSATCSLFLRQIDRVCGLQFYHLFHQGADLLNGQGSKNFDFRMDSDNHAVYEPPVLPEVVFNQWLDRLVAERKSRRSW